MTADELVPLHLAANVYQALTTAYMMYNMSMTAKRLVAQQTGALRDASSEALARITAISGILDEQVRREMVSGFDLLDEAVRIADPALKREQLMLARTRFANLVALSPDGMMGGKENQFFRTAGFYGNFHYFAMSEDPVTATRQPLLCARDHPLLAVYVFGPRFFGEPLFNEVKGVLDEKASRDRKALEALIAEETAIREWGEAKAALKNAGVRIAAGLAGLGVASVLMAFHPAGALAGVATFRAISQKATYRNYEGIPASYVEVMLQNQRDFEKKAADLAEKISHGVRLVLPEFNGTSLVGWERLMASHGYA
jgi:hypothetical protein